MQERLKNYYPHLNKWWCWLFAYAFVSRVWGKWLRCCRKDCWDINTAWKIAKWSSGSHFLVEYNGIILDWHWMRERDGDTCYKWKHKLKVYNEFDKASLALSLLEWWWNDMFYQENYLKNWGTNKWDVIRTFLSDFEGFLDLLWADYSSWI